MTTAISQELREVLTTLARGDVSTALPTLEQFAEAGDAIAQYTLGTLYANGEGVELDHAHAAQLLQQAADQGLADAQRDLAWCYANGYGVQQDNEQARHWYQAAADNDDAEAQFNLGVMYHFGRYGAEPDVKQMLHWYETAGRNGHAKAQFAMGKLLANGGDTPQDDEAAFQWLTIAIMNGSEPAKQELAMLTARIKPETLEQYKQTMMKQLGNSNH